MRFSRRWTVGFVLAVALLGAAAATRQTPPPAPRVVERAPGVVLLNGAPGALPNGQAPVLSCEQAEAIVAHAREQLVSPPVGVDARAFSRSFGDWLDPYGLWSAAPDAPIQATIDGLARELVAELEGAHRQCASFLKIGGELKRWVDGLAVEFEGAKVAGVVDPSVLSSSIFEGEKVTQPARDLTQTLAVHARAFRKFAEPSAENLIVTATARYFPNLTAETWQRVALSAAVRAYVQALDPHGAWSPRDEEGSLYESELAAAPPLRLWERIEPTSFGLRIEAGAAVPLMDGDVLLSLAGVATGGMPPEQAEALGSQAASGRVAAEAMVWRDGKVLVLEVPPTSNASPVAAPELDVDRIRYGTGDILLVAIHDVREDLGQSLATALLKARAERSFLGVVLDLRGNGGGDPEGASDALGLFMPGVPLFPMRRRHATVAPDRASVPPFVDQWRGPVATLVDSETASAAEMIAGALMAYGRGPSIGERTFGKGCVQEYFPDPIGAGSMRLTTMVYALPDGRAVQKVGITPTFPFSFGSGGGESEASMAGAPDAWSGVDVRTPLSLRSSRSQWPRSGGRVGPCSDELVCGALTALGAEGKHVATALRGR